MKRMDVDAALLFLDNMQSNESSNDSSTDYHEEVVQPIIRLDAEEPQLNISDIFAGCLLPELVPDVLESLETVIDNNLTHANVSLYGQDTNDDTILLTEKSVQCEKKTDKDDPDYISDNERENENDLVGSDDEPSKTETGQSTVDKTVIEAGNSGKQDAHSSTEAKPRSRKRKRNIEEWKHTIRKRRRQSGQEYENSKGKKTRKRQIQSRKDCEGKCKFHCSRHISAEDRSAAFNEFWGLDDTAKQTFYARTTEKCIKERTRTATGISRRTYSFKYYFAKGDDKVRVCKEFYLTTLDISQRRIEWHYKKAADNDFTDRRGRASGRSRTSDATIQLIKEHIQSFPRIPSHYCRQQTKREFLEPGLSLAKMYAEKCKADDVVPVKIHLYRSVFNYDFNIGFFVPKKDRCDTCMEYEAQDENTMTEQLKEKHNKHINDKNETRTERDEDRKSENTVVCFDLQNVLTCPRANISIFLQKEIECVQLNSSLFY